jgi:hypothetical protein
VAGETAQIHVGVVNDSTVDVTNFKSKVWHETLPRRMPDTLSHKEILTWRQSGHQQWQVTRWYLLAIAGVNRE